MMQNSLCLCYHEVSTSQHLSLPFLCRDTFLLETISYPSLVLRMNPMLSSLLVAIIFFYFHKQKPLLFLHHTFCFFKITLVLYCLAQNELGQTVPHAEWEQICKMCQTNRQSNESIKAASTLISWPRINNPFGSALQTIIFSSLLK